MARVVTAAELVAAGLDPSSAEAMAGDVNSLAAELPADQCWHSVSKDILSPEVPFEVHRALFAAVYDGWDESKGPAPAWTPTDDEIAGTNIAAFMEEVGASSYDDLFRWSAANRDGFWGRMIARVGIRFRENYDEVVDLSGGAESPKWLPGAKLNAAESCFKNDPGATAIIYEHEGGDIRSMTYGELDRLSNRVAGGLAACGLGPGDAIAGYMPMTAESVAIYLGVVKAGGVVVSIADSFAPDEIAKRIRLAGAKFIFTQDYHRGRKIRLYEKVVAAEAPRAVVLPGEREVTVELRDGDLRWNEFLAESDEFDAAPRDPHDHSNILFSSGTTGDPKAIPWTHTTPIKCAVDAWLHHDVRPGDVLAWPSNLGWMMGPWLIYAALVNDAAMALYYGSPTTADFAKFVQDAGVTMLGEVPSMVKAWRSRECTSGLDWSKIRCFSSTGECSNHDDMLWLMSAAGYKPIIEYCGGTEIGGGYITGTVVQPAAPATFSTPALGLDLLLVDSDGAPAEVGEIALVPPSIGLSTELLNRDHFEVYFKDMPAGPSGETLRRHGDQMERLGGGYYKAQGRADDTMNLSGIKVSSTELERTVNAIEGVAETAAIASTPPGGGPDRLVIYTVADTGASPDATDLKAKMQGEIKRHLNPLFKVHDAVLIDSLPRTASNKVMRRKLRALYAENAGE